MLPVTTCLKRVLFLMISHKHTHTIKAGGNDFKMGGGNNTDKEE